MSKTKNEERLEVVNKRLAEINEKDVFPKREKAKEEVVTQQVPKNTSNQYNSNNKLKTYLIRVGIVVGLFFVIKSIDFSNLVDSSVDVKKDDKGVQVDVKVDVPKKEEALEYNFTFKNDEHIIVFGKYQSEEEALKEKEIFSKKFIEFPVNHFFLPNKSNSKEEVYQLYLGPINGLSNAKQWSKLIEIENILLSF